MEELSKHGQLGRAAMKASMDPKTARKYREAGRLPSEMKAPMEWRTRVDPFERDWPLVMARLEDAPELESKTLFEWLQSRDPERYEAGQLRTLQRRVRQWRAQQGPDRRVYFAQAHVPGEAAQTDFTWATELGITIGGEPFEHMLCHVVLPYSNWQWATVCHSESLAALKHGVQSALFRLGRVPQFHQTDNSTAATHDLRTGKRGFNEAYVDLMKHFGMTPRTTGVGEKEQNGDVEAANGALKRRLEQHLLMRGHRDFDSRVAYEAWLRVVLESANMLRAKRVEEELHAMRPLCVDRLPEHVDLTVLVTSWSTIRVKRNTYSVPSRLIGERVKVRLYEDRVEVWYGGERQLEIERLRGEGRHRINYRHIIWSLVQKPGAFRRYKYREDLFPTVTFRRGYDALQQVHTDRKSDVEYLRVLHLAASTMESEVEAAIELLLQAEQAPDFDAVKALVAPTEAVVPEIAEPLVDLAAYDDLLESRMEVAQ